MKTILQYLEKYLLLTFVALFCGTALNAQGYDQRYGWPSMKAPENLIICSDAKGFEEQMLLESLSGLAAKSVNEGRSNEMVWMGDPNRNPSYKRILDQSLQALKIQNIKKMDLWNLVSYLKKKHIVKGYVLYSKDQSKKGETKDYSSNVATVYASLLNGVLIEESLEKEAKALGLKKLKDARNEDPYRCFRENKHKLNNSSALSVKTTVSNMRDYAIAHGLMLFADDHKLAEEILEWVRPLSPILGWGCGDEYEATSLISEWGHYNTASDWCSNLPFISAAAPYIQLEKAHETGPEDIDFSNKEYVHSFVMSDGDNMQWTIGAFADNVCFAGNPHASETAVSWTLCPINLSVVSPVSWNILCQKQSSLNSLIEYGGGYQYPDLFASKRPNRLELVREFAKRINLHMKEMDIKIFGALFEDIDSKEAQEAMQIYAEELEDISGMLAIQYFPYETGKNIYWYKNKKGIDIPMLTADFSIWDEVHPGRPNCGTPEFVASMINREFMAKKSFYSWTIVHAWSNFRSHSKITEAPACGVNPIRASESLLVDGIRPVSFNELLWRVRMEYRPEQTRQILQK